MPFPKQKAPISASSKPTTDDSRFASLQTDPRYRLPSKKHTHTKLDSRFSRILKNDDFTKKASVDRYGRKLDKSAGKKELERLYSLEDDDEDEIDDEEVTKELRKVDAKYDPARDGGFSDSSSEEESEEEDDEEVEEAELYGTEEQVKDIPEGEVSARLAVVNMDWDNVRAVDIMAVALSFLPAEGRILSVNVYPSEFGRERMDREELEGPPREIFAQGKKKRVSESDSESESEVEAGSDEDSEDEEERIKKSLLKEDTGEEYNSTALRKYQLDRLRYYYAVIQCNSPNAAKSIYDNMDGREYLSSANFFDLRFIPDEVTFDETPRDTVTEIPRDYKPHDFVTDALRHSKVKLTWDADDKQRKEVQKRAFSRREIDENDLQAYIGSGSSSEEENESDEEVFLDGPDADTMSMTSKSTVNKQAKRDAMRAALGLGSEPEKGGSKKDRKQGPVGNMEVSFTPGLSASSDKKSSVFENDAREVEETSMEKYIRKERERKQRRKERAKARREGRDPDQDDNAGSDEEDKKEEEEEAATAEEELGFQDPFFTDPALAEKEHRKARKARKAAEKASRAAEEAATASQRAELELLMAGEGSGGTGVQHFDMREIRRAEKAKNRKGKKGSTKAEVVQDGFEMDVKDPRFERLFESHEFAIDPTNPRFKKTEGMGKLMEEGRRKRAAGAGVVKEEGKAEKRVRSDDLGSLVEKVKKRIKT